MPDVHELTLVQAAEAIRSGEISPTSLVGALLDRIDRHDSVLQAWVTVDREGAMRTAEERERQLQQGNVLGPLHGIPIGVKDIFHVEGLPTIAGSSLYADRVSSYDATSVARLKDAGAIVLGKTVTCQFASTDPGPTRNPWNPEHTPGGSSQGSAAAVAAGMCFGALGTQTGGSVLRPSTYCGLVGLKPTYGRISRHGVLPLSWSIDTVGVLCRSLEDAATLLQCMAGRDEADSSSSRHPVDDYVGALDTRTSPPRLGLVRDYLEEAEPEVRSRTEAAAERLAKAGATIVETRMPDSVNLAKAARHVVHRVEAAAYHEQDFARAPDSFEPEIRSTIELGMLIPGTSYLQAQRLRRRFRADAVALISTADALILPTTPASAPRGLQTTGPAGFQAMWTFAGVPTLTLPLGLDDLGLPLGLQIVGQPFEEAGLLATARWCEDALQVNLPPPPL